MLRSLLVLCLVWVTVPVAAQEYRSNELADAARDWRQELIDSVPANKKRPNLSAALRRTAEIEYQAKDYTAAIGKLTSAIANGADDGLVWLRLAQSELAANVGAEKQTRQKTISRRSIDHPRETASLTLPLPASASRPISGFLVVSRLSRA